MISDKQIPLSECIDFIVDNRGKTAPTADSGIPLIATNCIDNENLYPVFRNIRHVSEDTYNNWFRAHPLEGDIILTLKGTPGRVCLVPENVGFVIAQDMVSIRVNPNKIYPLYLFAALRSRIVQHQIKTLDTSGVIPNLKKSDFDKVLIPKTDPNTQKYIGDLYHLLSLKAEHLKKQNHTLETMAQTIFKEWFGKYQIGDELPEGWRVGRLKDLGNIICGKTPSKADNENFGGNIPFIKIPDMHNKMFIITTTDSLTKKGVSLQKNKLIPKNSICVSCIATVGLVSITSKDSQTNQQINSIIPFNDSYKEFIYFKVKGLNKYLHDIGSGGTATLNVNTTSFSNIEIVIPDAKKLYSFSKITNPIFKKVLDNDKQIQSLTKTRDTLLPKLMSGQVRVKNIKHTADA